MKPPDDPVPSGDRTIAQSLLSALHHMDAAVTVASTLRSRDGKGDESKQREIMARAQTEIERLIPLGRTSGWQAWITYHTYYKAPDLIGPAVCHALSIPYLQVESTRARKRLKGPWTLFAQASEAAVDAADVVFYFTTRDAQSLVEHAPAKQKLIHLRPFLTQIDPPQKGALNGPMLSVGMMRQGDKFASYQIVAQTLALLEHNTWHLEIAGDGPARTEVEALMAPFGDQVQFLGQLNADDLRDAYHRASLMFWPGVNEALGLVYLEAQAAGLPIVAQDRPGMREVLAPFQYPDVDTGEAGLATLLSRLLGDAGARQRLGRNAREHVIQNHLMHTATETLLSGLAHVGVTP